MVNRLTPGVATGGGRSSAVGKLSLIGPNPAPQGKYPWPRLDSENVSTFPQPPAPPEPPAKLEDEWVFAQVCQWKIARAKQQIAWAEHERKTLIGNRSDEGIPNDMTALDEMQSLEFHLSRFVPDTVLTARALLGMAVEILAYAVIISNLFEQISPLLRPMTRAH
jgi:hypothetical protein